MYAESITKLFPKAVFCDTKLVSIAIMLFLSSYICYECKNVMYLRRVQPATDKTTATMWNFSERTVCCNEVGMLLLSRCFKKRSITFDKIMRGFSIQLISYKCLLLFHKFSIQLILYKCKILKLLCFENTRKISWTITILYRSANNNIHTQKKLCWWNVLTLDCLMLSSRSYYSCLQVWTVVPHE